MAPQLWFAAATRNENQPKSCQRATADRDRKMESVAWSPTSLRRCCGILPAYPLRRQLKCLEFGEGQSRSSAAMRIFGLFLPRYDVFHLSRVAGLRLLFGRAVSRRSIAQSSGCPCIEQADPGGETDPWMCRAA